MSLEKHQHCDFCGDDLGVYVRYGREPQTCGKPECELWARDEMQGERDEAHEQLDRDMGYGRF